jgi:hypothetical protein
MARCGDPIEIAQFYPLQGRISAGIMDTNRLKLKGKSSDGL